MIQKNGSVLKKKHTICFVSRSVGYTQKEDILSTSHGHTSEERVTNKVTSSLSKV